MGVGAVPVPLVQLISFAPIRLLALCSFQCAASSTNPFCFLIGKSQINETPHHVFTATLHSSRSKQLVHTLTLTNHLTQIKSTIHTDLSMPDIMRQYSA